MIGTRISAYDVLSELGSGGMGTVYLGEVAEPAGDLEARTRVALKVIHPHLLTQPGFFKRFLLEGRVGKQVDHENVVRTYDCDATLVDGKQQNFLVMEYVEGQTLRALLDELGRVPEELCRHIGREVAQGLAAIHAAGVLHRDIKPENVLITEANAVKVMDLGVARLQDEAIRLSQTGVFLGSVEYAAPEQFTSGKSIDARADLHALGVMLYELATGQNPYRGDDVREVLQRILSEEPRRAGAVNPQVSPFFEEAVHKLLAKDREGRFATATEVAQVLTEGEDGTWWRQHAKALRVETRKPLRRMRIPRETALYGRDEEIARLETIYARVKAGDGQVLLIEGEAGCGKTRLVDEFVGTLERAGEDLHFLFGSYPPGGAATAAGAFSTAYREEFGAEALEETLRPCLDQTPALVPAFAALLRGDATPTGSEPLTKESLQTVFVHTTRALARDRPTIVLIDDLHFAPTEGRALFAALAQATAGHRILLVGTTRRGLPADWTAGIDRLENGSQMALHRLGPKDLGALLIDAFGSKRLAQDLALKIATKSDGNPFFVFEILRGLRENELVTRARDGSWVTTREIREITVPSSVLDLVQARMAGIDEQDRELLEVASCCGFEFDPLLVGHLLGMADIPLLKRLGRIENTRYLVRSVGRHFVFDHHQVQEALYEGITPLLRERYHAALAVALEGEETRAGRTPADAPGPRADAIAEHFFKGGEPARAQPYLEAALDHLEASHLNNFASELAERALDAPGVLSGAERFRMLLRAITRLDLLGRREEQEARIREAATLADELGDPGSRAAVGVHRGRILVNLGRHAEATPVLEEALAMAAEVEDLALQGSALTNLGHCARHLGRVDEAWSYYRRRSEIAEASGDIGQQGRAAGNIGLLLNRAGRLEEAAAHHRRDLELSRAAGDRQSEAMSLGNLAGVLDTLGRPEEARTLQEACLALGRELGNRRTELIALFELAGMELAAGRWEAARAAFLQVGALAHEIHYRVAYEAVAGNLGLVCNALGRLGEALAQHEEQLRRAPSGTGSAANAHVNRIDIFHKLGDLDAAREAGRLALELTRSIRDPKLESYALHNLAGVALSAGDRAEADRLYGEALSMRETMGYATASVETTVSIARLRLAEGDEPKARALLEDVVPAARRLEVAAGVLLGSALLARITGDVVPAVAAWEDGRERVGVLARAQAAFDLWQAGAGALYLEVAHELLAGVVEHAPERYRKMMIENVPLHRAITTAYRTP